MGRSCEICGKKTGFGHNVPRKGLLKKKGGTGSKVGVKTKRTFKANIMNKFVVVGGVRKKLKICTRCIRTLNKVS
ncbi:MAG: 50S ribosomal protein L28 [Spirochaetes bacterium GWF1_31_7]|nr:MAG: 50S ribosomal protein L28 [Spirochaetes bacterium GWE1_32_154]OHD47157.1 MAG: 50S ribosomal protein L28 [Spirochaetes bacterium GWF1_31_7]OHD47467.1 MAG: 50S ribosomal protein L28 [Spirochaetes bacterium GWE2_31_10]OHD83323.1 MAG: 50S ribosomal protein L28 [Spirochaetes bacterium RIFOXYB1_FULL_32_8]HBD94952.1 50S ribosomal protein L28 [Spirochaetia bacterium]